MIQMREQDLERLRVLGQAVHGGLRRCVFFTLALRSTLPLFARSSALGY